MMAIIGVLANIIIIQAGGVMRKTRDSRRKADIAVIQQALTLYFVDHQAFPSSAGGALAPNAAWCVSNDPSWDFLAAQLAPYVNRLPKDPLRNVAGHWAAGDFGYAYFNDTGYYGSGGRAAMLVYELENTAGVTSQGATFSDGHHYNYYPSGITIGILGQ